MVLSTIVFLFLFLPIVLLIYYNPWIKEKILLKNLILLDNSLRFCTWRELIYLALMSIIVNYFSAILEQLIAWLIVRYRQIAAVIRSCNTFSGISIVFD